MKKLTQEKKTLLIQSIDVFLGQVSGQLNSSTKMDERIGARKIIKSLLELSEEVELIEIVEPKK